MSTSISSSSFLYPTTLNDFVNSKQYLFLSKALLQFLNRLFRGTLQLISSSLKSFPPLAFRTPDSPGFLCIFLWVFSFHVPPYFPSHLILTSPELSFQTYSYTHSPRYSTLPHCFMYHLYLMISKFVFWLRSLLHWDVCLFSECFHIDMLDISTNNDIPPSPQNLLLLQWFPYQ